MSDLAERISKARLAAQMGREVTDADFAALRSEVEVRWIAEALEKVLPGLVERVEIQYGITSKWGVIWCTTQEEAEFKADRLRTDIEEKREWGDLDYHGKVMKRRIVHWDGPWEEVSS